MSVRSAALALVLASLALFACTLALDFDALERCTNHVVDGDETDVDCGGDLCDGCSPRQHCLVDGDCATEICPSATLRCVCPEGEMLEIEVSADRAFCIDLWEVEAGDYLEFATNATVSDELEECSYKTTHLPAVMPAELEAPITYVDWCDAWAYCDAVDKHLCGGIDGSPNRPSDFKDATRSQWFLACTKTSTVVEDLIGSVAEWEDSCDGAFGEDDFCRTRGGADSSEPDELRCDLDDGADRNFSGAELGFRCCSG